MPICNKYIQKKGQILRNVIINSSKKKKTTLIILIEYETAFY